MEKHIKQIFDIVENAVSLKKVSNENIFGEEFIQYSTDQDTWVLEKSNGYSDKILRIPFACFLTMEHCVPQEDAQNSYHLCTYTPCKLPVQQKCRVIHGIEEDMELHRHDYFEMIYVYKGKRTTQIEGQEIVLNEQELCIFDMQCAHRDFRKQSEGIAFYYCFTSRQIDSYFLNGVGHKYISDFFQKAGEVKGGASYLKLKADSKMLGEIEKNIAGLFMELEYMEAGYDRMAQVYMLRLIKCFHREQDSDVVVFSKKLRGTKLFQAVARYISSNIADISLDKLCAQFHYQVDYYNRLIKKNTGVTYSEYVRELRMEKAKNLLINTDIPVQEILLYLGYEYHSYFYKVFYKETGMTPIEYRESYKGKKS